VNAPIPEKIGKYLVQEVLGKGAMGTVYRGFDPAIKRPVALKVISRESKDPAELDYIISRFRQEAEAVGRLSHPKIAAIYDFIDTGEVACIVMELVIGKSLSALLREGKRHGFKEIWSLILQVLEGLAYCHAQGVIHRDLKPDNILVCDDGGIKITDFGVARLETSTLTVIGDIVGTPHYMAPEQFGGEVATPKTDLYQVGVLLFELLVGARPFKGNSIDILRQVMNDRPADPSTLNPDVTPDIDRVVQRAMAKNPGDRFASPREFAEALKAALEKRLGETLDVDPAALTGGSTSPVTGLLEKARLLAGTRPAEGAEAPASPAAEATFSGVAAAGKARVLFVDDEERILNALRALFRSRYHVFTADNGAQALEFVRRFGIHVVVSDQRMPGMTGVELLRQVKDLSPASVRLLLTGYSDLAAIVGSINDGEVFRFVKKPWDNDEMQATLADAAAIALDLAAARPGKETAVEKMDAAVVVVDTGPSLADGLKSILAGVAPVRLVGTAEEAVRTLEAEEVALIVADLSAGQDPLVSLFEHLKARRPEILAILVTESSDSELVIELINQAQIFRFLNKPIQVRQLRAHVEAALARYRAFAQDPALARSQKAAGGAKAKESALGAKLLARIQSLPSRIISPGT
jgi:serine/threonine-protein kinase